MWKYQLTYGDISIDMDKVKEYTSKMAYQRMYAAANAFLRTVVDNVPVWTGEAMGSLQPLASALHVSIPKSPHPEAPYNGFFIGASQSVGSISNVINKVGPFIFEFNPGIDVEHFKINDQYDVSRWGIKLRNPTPWNAFEKGKQAAMDVLRGDYSKDFPKYMDVVIIKNKVGVR